MITKYNNCEFIDINKCLYVIYWYMWWLVLLFLIIFVYSFGLSGHDNHTEDYVIWKW